MFVEQTGLLNIIYHTLIQFIYREQKYNRYSRTIKYIIYRYISAKTRFVG